MKSPDWRFLAVGGLTAGLALSPLCEGAGGQSAGAALALALASLAALSPSRARSPRPWVALVALVALCTGLLAGAARLRAIDRGAYAGRPGARLAVRGHVAAVPRRSGEVVRVRVDTPAGRLLLEAPEPVSNLPVGAEVRARGTVAEPPPWYQGYLRRQGVRRIVRVSRIDLTGRRRGGLPGRIDRIRLRAEEALTRGMPEREEALARGFVLGEDDRIDPRTAEDFRRSGLAHLLAVSGQNVLLLALLAAPFLAALGIPLRARLVWLLALIALYVPLAGGGPSIQRAGAMGAAAMVATLAGRPASRVYALLLAAAVTLALNPRASGDVGWQLSFAAVCGIFLAAGPLRRRFEARLGAGGWRRALAEGLAVTIAATVATAPLMAHHFESLSATTLVANLLAFPAVAPAMWLGMLAAGAGQVPGLPVEPLNWVNALLLAYIAQVAEWLGRPGWALAPLRLDGWPAVAGVYAAMLASALVARAWARSWGGMVTTVAGSWRALAAATGVGLLALGAAVLSGPAPHDRPAGLRVTVLDVGQGDAILLQPHAAEPVLVDGGPRGAGLRGKLEQLGVSALAAAVVTHDQSDHAGGIEELFGALPVRRLVYAEAGRGLLAEAAAAGAVPTRLAEGGELRTGGLRLEALWPPGELAAGGATAEQAGDPNARSLVLLARWRDFEMLLTGDAEAEAVPMDPGPLDVLKVSHHGSADAGLAALLDRAAPRLAVISVGAENPFGHPEPGTMATLEAHGVPVLRTDVDGSVTIEAAKRDARVDTER
ncbi:MAG: ComEC/Rec2 family competence protein [Actinomycetota bacterium]